GAHFEGIGIADELVLGFWDRRERRYRPIAIEGEVEIVALSGDIVTEGDHPAVQAHLLVASADGATHGGHLLRARARPRLELVLQQSPRHLCRRIDPETGLALLESDSILS